MHDPQDAAVVYRETLDRMAALAGSLDGRAAVLVPACPAWTVHDVYAHVAGIVDDLVHGRVEDLGSEEWTAAQVNRRRDRTLTDVVQEWSALVDQLAEAPEAIPSMWSRIVGDLAVHEHDLAGAIGRDAPRDSDAVAISHDAYAAAFVRRVAAAGLDEVAVVPDDATEVDGAISEEGATVRASRFELWRGLTGRRSPAQLAAFRWSVDPTPYVRLFSAYGSRVEDLPE